MDAAIAVEEAASQAALPAESSAAQEEPLVSRDGQKGGLFLATGLYGIALGGIFATGYTLLRRRLRTPSDVRAAWSLAGAALLGIVGIPYVKYPPNPPAVGDPGTINQRTISYLAIVVIGLVAVWAAVVAQRTQPTEWRRGAAAVLGFVVVVVIGYALLPNINEVPSTFPPDLLWSFRLTSLGTQVVLWTVLGLAFGALVARTPAPRPETVAAA
ncbi:membrane protein [Paractinoplanes abujensis]|nr:membrane protein [Actinoplanes abujensis]